MFKAFVTLLRGQAAASAEQFTARNALLILDQQIRDGVAALERVKRSLAVAIAQEKQEAERFTVAGKQIADLESRVREALKSGDDSLAHEGAGAIAALEADRRASSAALALLSTEVGALRSHIQKDQVRLAELQRGRRLARVSDATSILRRGRLERSGAFEASISDAEKTLKDLRERQVAAVEADAALVQIDNSTASITERLAAKGFGPRLNPTADEVLARLQAKLRPEG